MAENNSQSSQKKHRDTLIAQMKNARRQSTNKKDFDPITSIFTETLNI